MTRHRLLTIYIFCYLTVNRFVAEDRLPHLLLYGPPGTGKTTTILAVARQLYPKNTQFGAAVLEVRSILFSNGFDLDNSIEVYFIFRFNLYLGLLYFLL